MRHVSTQWLDRMKKDGGWVTPKPFPGLHPLRWRVHIEQEGKAILRYIGKPNATVAKAVWGIMQNPQRVQRYMKLEEFDKEQLVIAATTVFNRRITVPNVQFLNEPLTRYYRPFTSHDPVIWAVNGIRRSKLTFTNKEFVAYVPVVTRGSEDIGEVLWQDHKRWLANLI